jgi:hypothetical protein
MKLHLSIKNKTIKNEEEIIEKKNDEKYSIKLSSYSSKLSCVKLLSKVWPHFS